MSSIIPRRKHGNTSRYKPTLKTLHDIGKEWNEPLFAKVKILADWGGRHIEVPITDRSVRICNPNSPTSCAGAYGLVIKWLGEAAAAFFDTVIWLVFQDEPEVAYRLKPGRRLDGVGSFVEGVIRPNDANDKDAIVRGLYALRAPKGQERLGEGGKRKQRVAELRKLKEMGLLTKAEADAVPDYRPMSDKEKENRKNNRPYARLDRLNG